MRPLAFGLLFICTWLLPATLVAQPWSGVDKEAGIAVFPFVIELAEDSEGLSESLPIRAKMGVRQAGNDAITIDDTIELSSGEWSLDDIEACGVDVSCYVPIAQDSGASFIVSGSVKSDGDELLLEVLLTSIAESEVVSRRTAKAMFAEDLESELTELVAQMLEGSETNSEPDGDEMVPSSEGNELLAYEVSKWVTLAAGAGLTGTGIAFAIFAGQKQDDYNDKFATEAFIDKDLKDEAETDALIANATLISGGILLGASIVLFILDGLDVGEQPLDRFGFGPSPDPELPGGSFIVRY